MWSTSRSPGLLGQMLMVHQQHNNMLKIWPRIFNTQQCCDKISNIYLQQIQQDDLCKDIFSHTKSLGTNAMSFLLQSVKSHQAGEMKLQFAYLATNYTVSPDKLDLQTYSMLTMWKEFWNLQQSWKSYWNIIQNRRSFSYITVCRTFIHSSPTHSADGRR